MKEYQILIGNIIIATAIIIAGVLIANAIEIGCSEYSETKRAPKPHRLCTVTA